MMSYSNIEALQNSWSFTVVDDSILGGGCAAVPKHFSVRLISNVMVIEALPHGDRRLDEDVGTLQCRESVGRFFGGVRSYSSGCCEAPIKYHQDNGEDRDRERGESRDVFPVA